MTTLVDRLETQRAEQQSTALAPRRDIFTALASERSQREFAVALPKVAGLTVERFTRVAITTLRTTPKLGECSVASLLSALVTTAQLGLEPGGPLGHAYLVPFGKEVTLIVGYQGYVALAYRSGVVDNISAELVREGDEYDLTLGTHRDLIHRPNKYDRSGKVQVAYAVCTLKDGGAPIFEALTVAQVEDRRSRSRAKNSGPWVTDWDQMARKTAVRALKPFLPMAVQGALAEADAHDEAPLTIDSVLDDDRTDATSRPIVIDSQPASNGAPAAPAAEEKPKRTRRSRAQTPGGPAAAEERSAAGADEDVAGSSSPPGPAAAPTAPPPSATPQDSPPDTGNGTPAVQEPSAGADATAPAPSAVQEPQASTAQMREMADKIIWLRNDAIALHPQVATKDRAQLRAILTDHHYFESGLENARLWINTLGQDELTSLVAAYRAVLFPAPEPEQTELPT